MAPTRSAGRPATGWNGAVPMEVCELGHLVLQVRDLERSVHFYRDVLGWRSLQDPDEVLPFPAVAFSAPAGRTHHELLLIEVGEDAAPMAQDLGRACTTSG